MPVIQLLSGILLLYLGAEGVIRGSSGIALKSGMSSLVVGLTVVAFGTSLPELVVSINAGINQLGDVAAGNVIGSNIFNIALILGCAACIRPLKVHLRIIRRDVPVLIIVTLLSVVLMADKVLSRIDAGILLALFAVYLVKTFFSRDAASSSQTGTAAKASGNVILLLIMVLSGLAALVVGARLFTTGSVKIAGWFNIPQAVIGLTIIAAGTSLPELATTVIATAKKESDIAIGNIIGSNIFNILAILGISGTIFPIQTNDILMFDQLAMVAVTVILFPFMLTGFRLNRLEGVILVGSYVMYTATLLFR